MNSNSLGKEVKRSEDKTLYKHTYPGDLVFNMMRAWQGAIGVVKNEGMVSPAYIVANPNDRLYPRFMNHYFQRETVISQINNLFYGVTDFRKRLYWSSFVIADTVLPSTNEQKNISDFLDKLSETITLHQRKLDLLKRLKQAYLQKMFPKSGEKVPEIRFTDFDEKWEQRKLGDIVQITMGQSPNSENYTENPNDYVLVQGNADLKNNRVVPRVLTTQITKQAEKGTLILSVRAPVGDIGKTDYDVVIGRGVAAIKGNNFIYQQLGKMKENGYWSRYSTGSTFDSINSNDIKEALITIPNEEEQKKIGTFFKILDNTIALHREKNEALKKIKKAFLSKIFL